MHLIIMGQNTRQKFAHSKMQKELTLSFPHCIYINFKVSFHFCYLYIKHFKSTWGTHMTADFLELLTRNRDYWFHLQKVGQSLMQDIHKGRF